MAVNMLVATNIKKSFSGVEVLHGVDFFLKKGEIHGLAGANGAGKSTLMKILNGVYRKDSGDIYIDGIVTNFKSPLDASEAGISMVFQDFSLVPTMSVSQNIFLGREPRKANGLIDHDYILKKTVEVLESLEVSIDPNEDIENLPVGTQQVVEIAKALSKDCRILILDEPTASLSRSEIKIFFELLKKLQAKGISIIIITHHLQEIVDICDSVTVLRDGDVVLNNSVKSITLNDIITALVGSKVNKSDFISLKKSESYNPDSDPCLKVENLCFESVLKNISFELRKGEVLGIAGLLGSGRTEILKNIYGLLKPDKGNIYVDGKPVTFKHPADARDNGISFVPEHRHHHGIIREQSVLDNILLTEWKSYSRAGFIQQKDAIEKSNTLIKKLKIKTREGKQLIEQLSGGNQQKVVIAKAIAGEVEILLLDEPTVGVDISSKQEILSAVRELASENKAVLMVSSEMEELAQVCDRVLVIKEGCLIHEFTRSKDEVTLTEDILISASQGSIPS